MYQLNHIITQILYRFQTDHTEELEELCQAANHLNESGGESGGEFWLSAQETTKTSEVAETLEKEPDTTATDLVVI